MVVTWWLHVLAAQPDDVPRQEVELGGAAGVGERVDPLQVDGGVGE